MVSAELLGRKTGRGFFDLPAGLTRPWPPARTSPGSCGPTRATRSARASNQLYRTNLAKGQTGLSIAFDLPTQTGYDPDAPEAAGEVGKVGVPVAHLGHMDELMDGIPVGDMNTSMTINATAAWLLGLYVAHAGTAPASTSRRLAGTTQNDIVKEYLSRGTYIFPPEASRRLIVDTIAWTAAAHPAVEPDQRVQLPPPGGGRHARPGAGLRPGHRHRRARRRAASGQVSAEADFPTVVGRLRSSSTPASASWRRPARCGPSPRCGTASACERYGVEDPKLRRFRYGVQVNSPRADRGPAGEQRAAHRARALGVTLSRRLRARALQLPAWNEALGLPRPWDQQWSLRIQQVLAYETDLLEYDDLFDGSHVVEANARRS